MSNLAFNNLEASTLYPQGITIGKLRQAIDGLADDDRLYFAYGNVVDSVFTRIDNLDNHNGKLVLQVSLVYDADLEINEDDLQDDGAE